MKVGKGRRFSKKVLINPHIKKVTKNRGVSLTDFAPSVDEEGNVIDYKKQAIQEAGQRLAEEYQARTERERQQKELRKQREAAARQQLDINRRMAAQQRAIIQQQRIAENQAMLQAELRRPATFQRPAQQQISWTQLGIRQALPAPKQSTPTDWKELGITQVG